MSGAPERGEHLLLEVRTSSGERRHIEILVVTVVTVKLLFEAKMRGK